MSPSSWAMSSRRLDCSPAILHSSSSRRCRRQRSSAIRKGLRVDTPALTPRLSATCACFSCSSRRRRISHIMSLSKRVTNGKRFMRSESATCHPIQTRGCGRWGAARYGAVLADEYVRAVLGLSRSVQGGKGSLRHLPNTKLIGQQAVKLWGFFANNAISRRDLDLWPLDLEIGPRGAGVPGTLPTKFGIRRPFRFPSRWRHGTDGQTDRWTGSTHF